jgi:hypothetical protein
LQYLEAVIVRPVVEDPAEEEDGDVLLGLWVEEVLAFFFFWCGIGTSEVGPYYC